MRKRYLFLMSLLFPLATMFMPGSAYAADPDKSEYDAAMAAIKEGSYYLALEVEGVKYYVDAQGALTDSRELGALFAVSKVSGGALYDVGILLEAGTGAHFSNSTLVDDKCNLHPNMDQGSPVSGGKYRQDGSNDRNDWERQVFYLNESGKFAIRSCNVAFGESSWNDAGRAFWTYEVGETGEPLYDEYSLPVPCYSYDPSYIFSFEAPPLYEQIMMVLNGIIDEYEEYSYDETGEMLNMGSEFGQHTDWDSWEKLKELIEESVALFYAMDSWDPEDPEAVTLEQVQTLRADIDSLYQAILDSEVPYMIPANGYYRIIANLPYKSETSETGYVSMGLEASYSAEHKGKAAYATLKRENANFIWKLTKSESGDSIFVQNAGMGTYISFTSPEENRLIMTEDATDASHVIFDYAGADYVDTSNSGNGDVTDVFYIRLASRPRAGSDYVHQNNHGGGLDEASPSGNCGVDTGSEQEVTFWLATHERTGGDAGTSEWYLEFVPDEEAEAIIENFDGIVNHDKLVEQNNDLRNKVLETLTLAKDVIQTKMITSTTQLSSPYSDSAEGQHLEYLLDGDASTFWHTDWHGEAPAGMYYNDIECHYLQMTGMEKMVGDCEMYICERSADNDRVKKLVLMGTDNLKNDDEDWEEMIVLEVPNTGSGQESTIPFHLDEAYPYVRMLVFDTDGSSYAFRKFWHAAEIQFYTVQDNPNSQFILMGEVAQALQDAYDTNILISDEALTTSDYNALLAAYEAFMKAGLVDPAEMREALTKYAKATEGVVEGAGPGYWSDMTIANAYQDLYAEVEAYNTAGIYTADQIHKYSVMLKAMQKSVMEQANGVKTDKWYRIMYPTEEMFDAYGYAKDGGDNCSDLTPEDQKTMWGTYVTTAQLVSEEVTDYDEDGEEITITNSWLEPIGGEDLRESDRLFFMNDDAIEDKDASMFRFVELESDAADYTPLMMDVKENMLMALDMCNTYTQGEPLITKASQFSSNASYPGNDGQKLESGCLIDGDFATYWHSDYGRTYCCVPYLQIALNEPVSGLIQVYVGRRNTSNGHVTRMYVEGSNDAENWTRIGYIETPYLGASTPVTSQPLDLGGTFSHLRFSMTQRYGTDGGSNIEFDPFAEGITADDYNVKYTYFHASEFQIYPVTANKELTGTAKAMQDAYTVANKVVFKDATAEDLAAAAKAYKAFQSEFNAAEGKTVLPNGAEKAPATYALQNKANGLFVMVSGTGNQNNIYLKTVPTLVGYKALGYERSLLSANAVDGVSCNNLHAGESNRRFCTWGSTEPNSNSGLIICEADVDYEAPAEFTYSKDIKPGKINAWSNSVSITPQDASNAVAYTCLGRYQIVEGTGEDAIVTDFLALKEIETIPAGEPAFYILGDTVNYDADDEYDAETVKFKFSADEKLALEGQTINGTIASLVNHTLLPHEIYFTGNYAKCIGSTGYYLSGPCVVLDVEECPNVDPEANYDFSICLGTEGDTADGVQDVATAIEKISQPGNVYSMDGKLLRTGATLNSLKSLGKGMYILNGVKVAVK
jgi:hypothetical protein